MRKRMLALVEGAVKTKSEVMEIVHRTING